MRYFMLLLLAVAMVGCSDTARKTSTDVPSSDDVQANEATPAETPDADSDPEPEVADTPEAISDTAPLVIDVRTKEEWESGHIEEAIHIPHEEIAKRIGEVTDNKDAKIVVYCAAGRRAGIAKSKLEELGFTNVENGGGIDDMKARAK